MRTDRPLLVSKAESAFQLSVDESAVQALIDRGLLATVFLNNQELVVYDSLVTLVRRKARKACV